MNISAFGVQDLDSQIRAQVQGIGGLMPSGDGYPRYIFQGSFYAVKVYCTGMVFWVFEIFLFQNTTMRNVARTLDGAHF